MPPNIEPNSGMERLSQSLFDASADLNPHQIEVDAFALAIPVSEGVLLADEVGLGKTIEAGLASQEKKLCHLGIRCTKRSTLSYANTHRSHEVFQKVFETMLRKTAKKASGYKFRFKNDLYSFDATTIDLCLGLYDWAKLKFM